MFSRKEKDAVIYLKAEGHSDRAIGRMGSFQMPDGEVVKLPSRETIDQWRKVEGDFYDAEFSGQYARACEDNLWDEHTKLRGITEKLLNGEIDPAAARAASDNIKWDLARRLRHIFGDRVAVGGDKDGDPINVTTKFVVEVVGNGTKNQDT